MNRPTILMPAYDFKPLLGGIANYGHELAVRFSREARVHVIGPDMPGSAEFDRDLPYEVTRIRLPQSGLLSYPRFVRALRGLMPAAPPDAMFCPMWFPDAAAARALLAQRCGTEASIVTVNNGVNPEIFRRIAPRPEAEARYRPNGERLLLTVTRLYPYKGVDRVLEALPAIAREVPGIRYLVVGIGPDRPRLEALTASLGLQSRVSFLGRLPAADI